MTQHALPPVPHLTNESASALRRDLYASRFTVEGIRDLLSSSADLALKEENPIPAVREFTAALDSGDTSGRALLALVFMLGKAALASDLDAAFPTLGIDGLRGIGLVEDAVGRPGLVRATVDLRPYEAQDDDGGILWWVASDLGEMATGRALDPEHVLGIGGATSTLISITPREKVATALDLGCGCGIQALHAARHATRVVATDISERALAITNFNIALNRPTLPEGHSIETRLGSMLEPVTGETFDLIVSNPPFVITPRGDAGAETWTYRDGGREGDTLVGDLVRSLDAFLADGGTAVMLANWEIVEGTEWAQRPLSWLADSAASAIVIQRDTETPARYASTWLRDGGVTVRDERWEPMLNAWLDDFASRGVSEIGFGHVLMRKTSAGHPFRVLEHVESTGAGPLGPRYREMLRTLDALENLTNTELSTLSISRADDVIERRHFMPGSEDPMLIDLVQGGGFGRTLQIGTHLAAVLGVLTGEYPLKVLLEAYAGLLEGSGADASRESIEVEVYAGLRELLTWGFVSLGAQAGPRTAA